MMDIVTRLRGFWGDVTNRDILEAADEIERLRAGGCARDQTTTQFCAEAAALHAENARLREALEKIAKLSKSRSVHPMSGEADYFRIARAALAGEKKDEQPQD